MPGQKTRRVQRRPANRARPTFPFSQGLQMRTVSKYQPPLQFIAGEWRAGGAGTVGTVLNPATGEVLAAVPRASKQDLDDALSAASELSNTWRRTSAIERAAILQRAAMLIHERRGDIAHEMTLEQGKTLKESMVEVTLTAEAFEWYAAEGMRSYGRIIPSRVTGSRQMVQPEPIGPVAAFTPWNFPALLPARKIAPALAAGCTMVMKPSEETPRSAVAIAQALHDAGLPAGVLNLVFGHPPEVSEHLIRADVIRKVTFTGSTAVGRTLAGLAAEHVKPCTLELGGHAPVIIFDDTDIDRAVATCVIGKTRNAGQVCTSPTRFFVQDSIYDVFTQKFSKALSALRAGPGLSADSQMGALANGRRILAMQTLVEQAVSSGARVAAGGKQIGTLGNLFEPTLLVDVPVDAKPMQMEPFGPIAMLNRFSDTAEAIREGNRLRYGLAAYVFTSSASTAMTMSEELQAGGIGINSFAVSHVEAPFGGVKDSGYGLEGGPEGLQAYTHTKYIHHAA